MASQHSSRLARRALIATGVIGVSAGLYITYRPRQIPGSERAAVPPPVVDANGVLQLPKFPRIKSREEQIADLKRSSGAYSEKSKIGDRVKDKLSSGRADKGDQVSESQSGSEDASYDLLVIGGGATGAGIALDAATRGLKVALVERDDYSSGTSSKSTKLVHGGVRYLEKAFKELDYNQYKLVKEALQERRYFLDTAPHLSTWLPIMLPIEKWWKAPYFYGGTKLYDFLAGSENIESSYFLTKSRALDAFPMLKKDGLFGALVYYDGAHNDSRMNVSLAMTAAIYGATVVNYAEVQSLEKDASGRLNGAIVKDLVSEKKGKKADEFRVKAKGVINATGPFTDSIRKMDDQQVEEIVAPSSGVHVMLPGYFSPSKMGLIDPSTSDGRVIFFLPWHGNTIAGTTDAPTKITQHPVAGEEEIQWILSEVQKCLDPEISVRRSDVLAAWSGIRPLVRDPKAKKTEGLVRNHLITTSPSGLITCSGGKWTTYRQMAEETVDEAIKEFGLVPRSIRNPPAVSGVEEAVASIEPELDGSCKTHQVRLVGAHGWSKTLFINIIQHFGLDAEVAKHLTTAYGDRAWVVAALCAASDEEPSSSRSSSSSSTNSAIPAFGSRGRRLSALYPFVDGEVRYAVRHEQAQTAVDVLARRTRLAFLNAQAALGALPTVIDIMAEELGWDGRRKDKERNAGVVFLRSMGLGSGMGIEEGRKLEDNSAVATASRPLISDSYVDLGENPVQAVDSPTNK